MDTINWWNLRYPVLWRRHLLWISNTWFRKLWSTYDQLDSLILLQSRKAGSYCRFGFNSDFSNICVVGYCFIYASSMANPRLYELDCLHYLPILRYSTSTSIRLGMIYYKHKILINLLIKVILYTTLI